MLLLAHVVSWPVQQLHKHAPNTLPGMPNAGVSLTRLMKMFESNSLFVSGCIHTPAAASREWMLRVPEPAHSGQEVTTEMTGSAQN
jgi:hypothetical protein